MRVFIGELDSREQNSGKWEWRWQDGDFAAGFTSGCCIPRNHMCQASWDSDWWREGKETHMPWSLSGVGSGANFANLPGFFLLSILGIDSLAEAEAAAHWLYSASLTAHQAPVPHPCLHLPSNEITAVWPPSQLFVSVLGIWVCVCTTTLYQLKHHPSLHSSSFLATARIKCPFSPVFKTCQQHVFLCSVMCAVSTLHPDSYLFSQTHMPHLLLRGSGRLVFNSRLLV